jgi:hypothetical protein
MELLALVLEEVLAVFLLDAVVQSLLRQEA